MAMLRVFMWLCMYMYLSAAPATIDSTKYEDSKTTGEEVAGFTGPADSAERTLSPGQEFSTHLRKDEHQKKEVGVLSLRDYFRHLFSDSTHRKRTEPVYAAEYHYAVLKHLAKRGIRFSPDDMESLEICLSTHDFDFNKSCVTLPDDAFDHCVRDMRSVD